MAGESTMNKSEDGRIHQAEQAIVGLSGRMDGFENQLTGINAKVEDSIAAQKETNRGLQVLLGRTGGMEATKGMLPVAHILTAVGIFIALSGLGMKLLFDHDQKIDAKLTTVVALEDKRHELVEERYERINEKIGFIREIADLKHEALHVHVTENDKKVANIVEELHGIQQTRFDGSRGLEHLNRITALEEHLARLEEKHHFTWEEIKDHEDEADHPIRQTYELENLKERVDEMHP